MADESAPAPKPQTNPLFGPWFKLVLVVLLVIFVFFVPLRDNPENSPYKQTIWDTIVGNRGSKPPVTVKEELIIQGREKEETARRAKLLSLEGHDLAIDIYSVAHKDTSCPKFGAAGDGKKNIKESNSVKAQEGRLVDTSYNLYFNDASLCTRCIK